METSLQDLKKIVPTTILVTAFAIIAGVWLGSFRRYETTAGIVYADALHSGGVVFDVRNRWGARMVIFRDYGFNGALDEVEIKWSDGTESRYEFSTGEGVVAHAWAEWGPRYYIARQEAAALKLAR